MDFKSFSDFSEFIRRYNSTSILEVGAKKCWKNWEIQYSNSLDWVRCNAERNYAIRLMLLASKGNPHRRENLNDQEFDYLVNVYYSWNGHTISDINFLQEEAKVLLSSIVEWEKNHEREVRNWLLKLSGILKLEAINSHMAGLFAQRLVAFQNAGFGHPVARIHRTIKFVKILDERSDKKLSNSFENYTGLSLKNYFRQFLACLVLFDRLSKKKGFCDFSELSTVDNKLQELGITSKSLRLFIQQNSALFSAQSNASFRSKVNQAIDSVPDYYQPLFYNYFLEVPFVKLNEEKFCLPDPFSFTESCWNQVKSIIFKSSFGRDLNHLLSQTFEEYLETILLPAVCPTSFEKIPVVKNPSSSRDKRADFLIKTPSSYIVIECKSSVMDSDTSAYFQADKVADLWCRIHLAFEQIGMTVEALNLHDKPVIPLILTFYDSIAASTVFEELVKQTNYCARMGLTIPPIVHSIHEFEHWIHDRSINNWSELILTKQNASSPVKPDNQGHNYKYLNDISII